MSKKSLYNRDLSWLQFNHRVLQEAADNQNPLYERIKFLAIFSSNLDEFFEVRVSSIRQLKTINKQFNKKLITKPNRLLKAIKEQVSQQQEQFGSIYRKQIIPALKDQGIHIIDHAQFSPQQLEFSAGYFDQHFQQLKIYEKGNEAIFMENETMALLVEFEEKTPLTLIKFPDYPSRFVTLPSQEGMHFITFLDDIIKANLHQVFPHKTIRRTYAVKINRDAELYIDDEYSGKLVDKIYQALDNRNTGEATRVLIDSTVPDILLKQLKETLDIHDVDIVKGGVYHNFKDFFGFPNPIGASLEFPKLTRKSPFDTADIFKAIDQQDRLIHFPYHSFEAVNQLVEQAAEDKQVTAIKISLYRVDKQSRLIDALLKACQNGKQVTIFVEAQARFDEENNIRWGKVFEQYGAEVIYSFPDIKVHSKILLIDKKEADTHHRYAYISTGNFNEKNAGIYGDLGIMTSNPEVTKEVNQVFQVLSRKRIIPKTNHLLVSPFNTRSTFEKLIKKEIAKAKDGKEGYIFLKMNSLEDKDMIEKLYEANNHGVKIELVIRGICRLKAGVKGQSEHIKASSIVGRFLEHSRIYIFGKGDEQKIFIGSADWMTRNLDRRIEVITPVLAPHIQQYLLEYASLQLRDNVKARLLDEDQKNTYIQNNKEKMDAQVAATTLRIQ
ncbi:polyphosphate kinase 1 [Limibacter armeniacum]|uniref:polyphosphate kinase 1 n=1 Tax=Limibacter armeniacum TaxID=466084 RepID=UPI002FE65607